ncbi:MAG: CalY family protein [Chloroflexi bacterium]|nr:CalY family protein [Chloroflexota bacterium]
MDTKALAGRRNVRRAGLILLLAASAALTVGTGASTLAIFTDSTDATAAFTTGTVDLTLSPTTVFTANGIYPGDSGSQTVTVTNGGTGTLRYAMSTSATNADGLGLAAQLSLTITAGPCPGAGGPLYGAAALGSAALGNPAQGAQAGDRSLAGAASEDLCFAWSLPSATGNGFQGAATTATFTFAAEQTASNP